MERPHPHLVALDKDVSDASEPEAAGAAPPGRRTSLILAMLLVAVGAGLLAQSWRASQLEGRVGELEAQLGFAQEELRAHEEHLGLVREAVRNVSRELTALEELVEQEVQ